MKPGKTITALAMEIERQSKSKRDFKAPTNKLMLVPVDDDRKMVVDLGVKNGQSVGQFKPTPLFHDQLGGYLKIPAVYYDRMLADAPDLLSDNVNHWLRENGETRLVRTLDGQARAFLSNRYRPIDNIMVAEAILPQVAKLETLGLRIESAEITDTRLYLKIFSERVTTLVKGEPVQAGVIVSNSEVGLHSYRIEQAVLICSCINGATIPKSGMRRYHIGRHNDEAEQAFEVFADDTRKADDRALMLKMRDVLAAAFDMKQFEDLGRMLNITAKNRIERGLPEVADSVVELYNLPAEYSGSILTHLVNGGDLTQWGLSNAVTAFSQRVPDYEAASELERVGGEILVMPEKEWQKLSIAA